MVKRTTLVIFILLSIFIIGGIGIYLNKKLDKTLEKMESKIEEKENKVDSLQNRLNYIYEVIDSLPIGPPLDTLIIQDDYGVRKHPIHGRWQMHSGIDMIDTWRDTVYSTGAGIVRFAGWNYGYGRCIEVEHAFGFTSRYAHLSKVFVKKGDSIIDKHPLGKMGATGMVTGQHLHYEISHEGQTLDPLPYINCGPIHVDATMYHPVKEQCDDTPLNTADGSRIDPFKVSEWNWIAVSQDLLWFNGGPFRYGDSVYVQGTPNKDGVYYIHDAMNKRMKTKIDFLENIGTPPYKYEDINLYVLKNN
jgi:3D (Asp-Asp-Asp) domain-containing protein|tara:strand:+ start:3566 stop:4477 length:912 start_codon:yes stop_codon:yes gene_type:complete